MKFCKRFCLVCFLILQVSLLKLNSIGSCGKWRLPITTERHFEFSQIWSDSVPCSLVGIDPCHTTTMMQFGPGCFAISADETRGWSIRSAAEQCVKCISREKCEISYLSCSLPAPECTQSLAPVSTKSTEAVSLKKLKQSAIRCLKKKTLKNSLSQCCLCRICREILP